MIDAGQQRAQQLVVFHACQLRAGRAREDRVRVFEIQALEQREHEADRQVRLHRHGFTRLGAVRLPRESGLTHGEQQSVQVHAVRLRHRAEVFEALSLRLAHNTAAEDALGVLIAAQETLRLIESQLVDHQAGNDLLRAQRG